MAQRGPSAMEELEELATPSSGSSDEEASVAAEPQTARRRQACKIATGVLCLLGACALALTVAFQAPQGLRTSTSARQLLESEELAELATDNVMALGRESLHHSVDRSQVREAAARKLMNISLSIRERHPEAHKKLELLQLSAAQKGQVFGVLRHYSDKRAIEMSNVVAGAVRETARTSGDEAALKRRLMEKLAPRATDLSQLGAELFPSRKSKGISFNFDDNSITTEFKNWHVKMEMSRSELAVAPARRLAAEDLTSGVAVQARSMFAELGEMFGDEMPTAPARMLEEDYLTSSKESFMECMMESSEAMDVEGCIACFFQSIEAVFAMISKMMSSVL